MHLFESLRTARAVGLLALGLAVAPALPASQAVAVAQSGQEADTVPLLPEGASEGPLQGPPEGPPEEISQERSRIDEAVRAELQALFDRVEALSRIDVEVQAGVVRLRGTVSEPQAAQRAVELASNRGGVLYVDDGIRLTTSLSDRLEPTAQRLRSLALDAVAFLPLLAVALLVVFLAGLAGRLLSLWGGPAFLHTRNPFLQALVARVIQALAVLAGILIALDLLEATALVGAVVGTAGLAGLAIGFAFKDIVENYLAGVLLALRQPFAQNDHVVVENFEGKVVRLTPRETILMTLDGNHIRLPNALVFGSPMLNYTRNPRRRLMFEMGVGPNDDLSVAQEVGIRTLHDMKGILDTPPPDATVQKLGDSSVTVRFTGWVDQTHADFGRVRSEAIRLVKLQLEGVGVSLPSPEYLVRMQSDEPSRAPSRATPPTGEVETAQGDVSVDHSVDQQIDEDRRASGEENLLGG